MPAESPRPRSPRQNPAATADTLLNVRQNIQTATLSIIMRFRVCCTIVFVVGTIIVDFVHSFLMGQLTAFLYSPVGGNDLAPLASSVVSALSDQNTLKAIMFAAMVGWIIYILLLIFVGYLAGILLSTLFDCKTK